VGNLKTVPFNAETDLPKLSEDLNIPETDILLYAPGQYSQMDGWAPAADLHLYRQMLFILTKNRTIFAVWDEQNNKFKPYYSFRDQDIRDMALYDGKPYRQIQLSSSRGFLAVNLLNTKAFMKEDSSDLSQTTLAAFDLLKSRNIRQHPSRGYVKVTFTAIAGPGIQYQYKKR
jgi:hypothetical protein